MEIHSEEGQEKSDETGGLGGIVRCLGVLCGGWGGAIKKYELAAVWMRLGDNQAETSKLRFTYLRGV